jgi:hypothetical protein
MGTWSQRSAVANCAGVSARIIQNSQPAVPAVANIDREKSRLFHDARFLHQIRKCIAASVKHADATMDQMMVTQLMFRFSPGGVPDGEEFVFSSGCVRC